MKLISNNCKIVSEQIVHPDEIMDAIKTIKIRNKLSISLNHPGKGPDFFLDWAKQEIDEADKAASETIKYRKYYNTSVLTKTAIECLIDWYLSKYLLDKSIQPMTSAAQKLSALDSDKLLGINFTLFNDIVFEPRNRGIHKYEIVEGKEAKHSLQLASLAIHNCIKAISPSDSPLYYGELEIYRNKAASIKLGINVKKGTEVFFFAGIGPKGSNSVLFDSIHKSGRICVLTSLEDGGVDSRYCKIRNNFSPEKLRTVFDILETHHPKEMRFKDSIEHTAFMESLIPKSVVHLTSKKKKK